MRRDVCACLFLACPDDSAEMQRAKLERSGFPDVVHLQQVEAVAGSDAAATHPPASGDGRIHCRRMWAWTAGYGR